VRTMLRFVIDGDKIKDLEIIEIEKRHNFVWNALIWIEVPDFILESTVISPPILLILL
jgi:hypothetical protein